MFCNPAVVRNRALRGIRGGPCRIPFLVGFVVLALGATSAQAEIENAGFSLTLSEKEMALAEPGDPMTMKFLMWDLSFQRMTARNMPYIEIRNNDTSDAPLTEVRLTIGDDRFHFNCAFMGECAMPGKTTPDVGLTSLTEDDGDLLVVQFADGGLAPGDVARFKIDLDPDADIAPLVFNNPDFRTVLFDMNGRNVYLNDPDGISSDDNASFWGTFEMAGMSPLVTDPVFFEDEIVGGNPGRFFNDNFRPYGEVEEVDSFRYEALGGGAVIPEPGTVVLATMGVLLALAVKRRR